VDPRARLDDVEKRKFLTLLGLEFQPVASRYTDCTVPAPNSDSTEEPSEIHNTLCRQNTALLNACSTHNYHCAVKSTRVKSEGIQPPCDLDRPHIVAKSVHGSCYVFVQLLETEQGQTHFMGPPLSPSYRLADE
jgi:hypothetical protein